MEPYTLEFCKKFSDLKIISVSGNSCVYSGVDNSTHPFHGKRSVALKSVKLSGKGQCRAALRELSLLKRLVHENVVRTYKIVDFNGTVLDELYSETNTFESMFFIEELMETDLHRLIQKCDLSEAAIKLLLYQLFCGLKYIHSANVIHRDIKPGNILVNTSDFTLKIGDYGLARIFDNAYEHKGYLTALVSTRFYRAPEIMRDTSSYSFEIDIWSAGCVLAEMLTGKPLFHGCNDLEQLDLVYTMYGLKKDNLDISKANFPEHLFEEAPLEALDLLKRMLIIDPKERITATDALNHPFFEGLHCPVQETICHNPFYIEDEIDDLPLNVLKRKIARNSSFQAAKFSFHESEENLFLGFDQNFYQEEYCGKSKSCGKSSGYGTDTEISSPSSAHHVHSVAHYPSNSDKSSFAGYSHDLPDVAKLCVDEKLDDEPCLDPARMEIVTDQPYLDPARDEHIYEEENSDTLLVTNYLSSSPESSYFHNVSPIMEPVFETTSYSQERSPVIDPSNMETSRVSREQSSFLGLPGHSCFDDNYLPTVENKYSRCEQNIDEQIMQQLNIKLKATFSSFHDMSCKVPIDYLKKYEVMKVMV